MVASRYREEIVENADEIANILSLNALDQIVDLIPIAHTIHAMNQESAMPLNS